MIEPIITFLPASWIYVTILKKQNNFKKVDFNAGVVAAGEAQIESTVTGNDSNSIFEEHGEALRDQSQVYLPINNALSEVGYVFL